jgi:hypothetical protein
MYHFYKKLKEEFTCLLKKIQAIHLITEITPPATQTNIAIPLSTKLQLNQLINIEKQKIQQPKQAQKTNDLY